MGEADGVPEAPSSPPPLPTLPAPAPTAAIDVGDADPWVAEAGADAPLPADQLAIRHVPRAARPAFDPGLPTASPSVTPTEFVRPDLVPIGDSVVAVLVGRVLLVVAALVVGIAARRSTGLGGEQRAESFWPLVLSAGVFVAVGTAGLMFWSAQLASNARLLRTRSSTPLAMVGGWLAVVAWVVVSSLTYLRLEVGGGFDPLPGVAGVGWVIVLALAYGRLQGVFAGLSRRPPNVWLTAFPVDAAAFGLVWWRLTDWPSPVGVFRDDVQLTANVAFGAAAALTVNVFVFARLAQRGSECTYERIGRLEARSRGDEALEPEWFRAGLAARPEVTEPASGPRRELVGTRTLAGVAAGLHVVWGAGLFLFGLFVAKLAFDYADQPVFLGDRLVVADSDVDRVGVGLVLVGIAYVGAIVAHGLWAVLAAINARRVTVHSPNPVTFVVAFAPMPILLGIGLLVGSRLGYWLVVVGLSVGFFASILINKMLLALSARLGGDLVGFRRWSTCIILTYVVGVGVNVLFGQAAAQLGLYATLAVLQGSLIAAGGMFGLGAMRSLDHTLRTRRRVVRDRGR